MELVLFEVGEYTIYTQAGNFITLTTSLLLQGLIVARVILRSPVDVN